MKGRLFNFLAAVSLVLCVGTTMLWVRSYLGEEFTFPQKPSPATTYLHSGKGVMRLRICDRTRPRLSPPPRGLAVYRPLENEYELRDPTGDPHYFGYGFVHPAIGTDVRGQSTYAREYIPFWSVNMPHRHAFFIAAVLPVCWLVAWAWRQRQQRDRASRGCCAGCGYNLTGNVSGVCPECGMIISAPAASGVNT